MNKIESLRLSNAKKKNSWRESHTLHEEEMRKTSIATKYNHNLNWIFEKKT